ncbi:hypothetical protein ES703_44585 [subsurface metagenome]
MRMQWLFDIVIDMVMKKLKGIIVAWSGTEANIPDGWALCDGTQGTPDLKLRFVLGSYGPGSTHVSGGSWTHNHDFTADGHLHDIPGGDDIQAGANFSNRTSSSISTGTTDVNTVPQPFYVLAFIMKL